MNINIKTTNFTLTPELKDYFDKKIEALDKVMDLNDPSATCQAELGRTTNHHKSGEIYRAEINIRKDGKHFRAVSEQESLMEAMDEVKDEILRELKNYKSKQTTLVRRGGAAIKRMIKGVGSFGGNVGSRIKNLRRRDR